MKNKSRGLPIALALTTIVFQAGAWNYPIHRLVNELAVESLPTNFPPFVRQTENVERIAFLSGEPDRWRNTPDLPLKHVNGPDHYFDVEDLELYDLTLPELPELRYDYIARLAVQRSRDPGPWRHLTEDNDKDHTKALCGLLPWTISEYYSRLKSGFSYLKAYEQGGGTPEEIANARENIVYVMGVMGHFVGDAAQPLHTTKHYNGWVGENPKGYTTEHTFHSWIDGGFWAATGIPTVADLKDRLPEAHPVRRGTEPVPSDAMFQAIVAYIASQHERVEPLYQLEREGGLVGDGNTGTAGKEFLQNQVLVGAEMLAALWVSAWQQAPPDTYLLRKLSERNQPEPEPGKAVHHPTESVGPSQ